MDSRERHRYKRLAVVVDTFPRWSERFIARELSELRRRGVDLTIFCLKAGTDPAPGDSEWDGLIERRVVLPRCILPRDMDRFFDQNVSEMRQRARETLGLMGSFQGVGCAEKFSDLLRDGKYRHVHAHFANWPSTIGWLAALEAKVPFSMSVHARDLFVEPEAVAEKAADAVRIFTCHTRATTHLAEIPIFKIPILTGKIVQMHHGLPLERFGTSAKPPRAPDFIGGKLLAAGRFVPKKGFQYAIGALMDQRLVGRNITLTLVGDGPEQQRLTALVKELKLDDRIKFIPPEQINAIKEAFESAHAFLAPYDVAADGDRDGISNVILEAFAYHLPVIGTDAGGLKEILTPKTGLVVPQKNSAAIAEAIVNVLEHPVEAHERACAARKLVEEHFDIQENIAPLLELIST